MKQQIEAVKSILEDVRTSIEGYDHEIVNEVSKALIILDELVKQRSRIIVKMDGGLIQYIDIPESLEHVIVEVRNFDDMETIDSSEVHMMEKKPSLFYGQEHTIELWERKDDPNTTDKCQSQTVFND